MKMLNVMLITKLAILGIILEANAKHIIQLDENSDALINSFERKRFPNDTYPVVNFDEEPESDGNEQNYISGASLFIPNGDDKRSSRLSIYGRGCIHRGGACDHRPNDCCFNSSCRCNLWGTNCRCQRMGLFQKWG